MSGLYRWAPPTWIFFHTFAAKINKEFFEANRDQCLSIIKMTCNCLPCPECTRHAIHFLTRVNGITVKTKEDFILMLFDFHNSVNGRLGKRNFNRHGLDKYNRLKFIKTTQYMCATLRRFNSKWLGGGRAKGTINYINLIENSVRSHIIHFL